MNYTKRQVDIILSATKLIGEKGIQNLTTKKLAADMKFTEAAIYRHFKGKTEIIVSVLDYYRKELEEKLKGIVQSENSGMEKIIMVMQAQFNHFSENPAIVMAIFAETSFQYDKVLSDVVLSILTQKKLMVEKIISLGQKDGSIRKDIHSAELSTIFMGSMRFTILRWRLNNHDFNLLKEGEKLHKAFLALMKC